jgi:hypothetical protein
VAHFMRAISHSLIRKFVSAMSNRPPSPPSPLSLFSALSLSSAPPPCIQISAEINAMAPLPTPLARAPPSSQRTALAAPPPAPAPSRPRVLLIFDLNGFLSPPPPSAPSSHAVLRHARRPHPLLRCAAAPPSCV